MQFLNPSRNFHGLFHLSGGFLLSFIISSFLFDLFVVPGTLGFQCLVIVTF